MFKKIFAGLLTTLCLYGAEENASVVIIGGGIGGLTSAVYLGQAGLEPVVLEGSYPGGAIAQSHNVRNWPGEKSIPGIQLTDNVRAQALDAGAILRPETVIKVDFSHRPYTITTAENTYKADSVIIANGSTPNKLGVPGEKEYWSNGVYTCAVCDGPLYKDKTIAIVGGGESAMTELDYLSHLAKKVYLIVRRDTFRATIDDYKQDVLNRPNVEVLFNSKITKIEGSNGHVTTLILDNPKHKALKVDALFLAIGNTPNTSLYRGQLKLDQDGYIALKHDQETFKQGVYAIGDIVDPTYKQAVIASGDGAKAAIQSQEYVARHGSPIEKKESHVQRVAATPQVTEINSVAEFDEWLAQGGKPALVDFYATWCGPCRAFMPTFEKLSSIHGNSYRFAKVNIDKAKPLLDRYHVRGLPTVIKFKPDGSIAMKESGGNINKIIQSL